MMHARNRGYTLVEMMVVLAIFTFAMAAITASIVYFYRSNTYAVEQTSAIQSGRKGIEYFVQDVREATYAEDGAYPIEAMSTSSVTFYADIDAENDVERVRYYLSSGSLMRGVLKASGSPLVYTGSETESLVSEYVRNLEKDVDTFQFKDGNGNVITDFSETQEVRSVDISLVVNVNPFRLPEEFLLSGSAALRNLRGI